MNLVHHLADWLDAHGLSGTPGVVAISGGPDSVALAHLGVELLKIGALPKLILAHVNHQLRGDESDADEAFVRNLPTHWMMSDGAGLACRTCRIDVAAIAEAESENLESAGRNARYDWLTRVAKDEGAAWIATGHTADDQAETVLFRLLRGTGVLGLRGIAEQRDMESVAIIRPLLTVRRADLLEHLKANGIAYRVDSSNTDVRFRRNWLRAKLLPTLRDECNPEIVAVLCRLAEQANDLQADIDAESAKLLALAERPRAGAMLVFAVEPLQSASDNQMREMFRAVWRREGWPTSAMDAKHWQRLVTIASGPASTCDFPAGVHVRRVARVMQISFSRLPLASAAYSRSPKASG